MPEGNQRRREGGQDSEPCLLAVSISSSHRSRSCSSLTSGEILGWARTPGVILGSTALHLDLQAPEALCSVKFALKPR